MEGVWLWPSNCDEGMNGKGEDVAQGRQNDFKAKKTTGEFRKVAWPLS